MTDTVTKEMNITEVVMKWPKTAQVFMEYGMHCLGCMASRFENIEQGANAHGIPIDDLMKALNKTVNQEEAN